MNKETNKESSKGEAPKKKKNVAPVDQTSYEAHLYAQITKRVGHIVTHGEPTETDEDNG